MPGDVGLQVVRQLLVQLENTGFMFNLFSYKYFLVLIKYFLFYIKYFLHLQLSFGFDKKRKKIIKYFDFTWSRQAGEMARLWQRNSMGSSAVCSRLSSSWARDSHFSWRKPLLSPSSSRWRLTRLDRAKRQLGSAASSVCGLRTFTSSSASRAPPEVSTVTRATARADSGLSSINTTFGWASVTWTQAAIDILHI